MRNLKRVLSLVLALVMAMSLMVVGTSAAFKDEADFSAEYVTAAEVLTNLNVLWGYEDGSFQPKGDITRAEVTALIYRAVTGDVTDAQKDVYSAMTNDFSDVKDGQWFAGYVNFCANAKYVAGYGDGTFGPNDKVTGYQTLAMILRAIGYDHNGEFIGEGWEMKTASIAQDIGMLENVKSEQLGKPATRELVAELIFQAMTAPMVKWVSVYESYRPLDKDGTTLGQKTFKLNEVEGVVLANEYANLGDNNLDALKAGKTQIDKTEYNLTTDTSIIGEKVSVWVADKDAVSTPISQAKVTDWSNLDAAEWTDDQEDEWADAINGSTKFYNNYDAVENLSSAKGVVVKAIDNDDDGDYEYVLAVRKSLAKIKNITTDGVITLNTMKSEKNQAVYANAKVGDVVLAVSYDGGTYIEKAPFINGIVSGYSTKGDIPTAKIGDKNYAMSDLANTASDLDNFESVMDTYMPGDDWNGTYYTYYQDAYGNIIAYEKAGENATQYGMILDYDVYKSGAFQGDLTWRPQGGINLGDLYVKFLTTENKVETAKVNIDGKHITDKVYNLLIQSQFVDFAAINAGDVVSYNINADGEFNIVYTYDCETLSEDNYKVVETDPDKSLANVRGCEDGEEIHEMYNVNDDLVVFYYMDGLNTLSSIIGGNYDSNSLEVNLIEALGTILPTMPVYGVLTGDEAIEDLSGGSFNYFNLIHQMDVEDAESNHTNKFAGDADMFNIRGMMDPFVDYCYVRDVDQYTSEKIGNYYYHTYDAINSKGEPIEVTTRGFLHFVAGHEDELIGTGLDGQVFAYLTVNQMGEDFNLLVEYENYVEGDIHQGNGGIEVYEEYDSDGKLYEAPEVYADVTTDKGGTTSVSKTSCTSGIVVFDSWTDETAAVFVTDKTADYVDVNIEGQRDYKHLKVGDTYNFGGCLKAGTEIIAHADANGKVEVAADWDGKNMTVVTDCPVCNPAPTVSEGLITSLIDSDNREAVVYNGNGDCYSTIAKAIEKAKTVDAGTAKNVQVMLSKDADAVFYRNFTSTASIADAEINVDILSDGIVKLANPGEYIALKITVDGTPWYAVFQVK